MIANFLVSHLICVQQGIGAVVLPIVQQIVRVIQGAGNTEAGFLGGGHAVEGVCEALAPAAAGGPLSLGGGHVDQRLVHGPWGNGGRGQGALQAHTGSRNSWPPDLDDWRVVVGKVPSKDEKKTLNQAIQLQT